MEIRLIAYGFYFVLTSGSLDAVTWSLNELVLRMIITVPLNCFCEQNYFMLILDFRGELG